MLPDSQSRATTVVFPCFMAPWGRTDTIQGLLELAGVPYVGSGVLGSSVCMDKGMAKEVLLAHGIPQHYAMDERPGR